MRFVARIDSGGDFCNKSLPHAYGDINNYDDANMTENERDTALGAELFSLFHKYELDDEGMILVAIKVLAAIYCNITKSDMHPKMVSGFLKAHNKTFKDYISRVGRITEGYRGEGLQ